MKIYDVTITYTMIDYSENAPIDPDTQQPINVQSGLTFRTRIKASNPGIATSRAVALFTMLGNFKDDDGYIFYTVNQTRVVTVTYPTT